LKSLIRVAVLAGLVLQVAATPTFADSGSFTYGTLSANPSKMAGKAKEAGFSHIWIYVPWRNVEPSKGRFLFKEQDEWGRPVANDLTNAIEAARQHGLKLVLRLDEPPAWAGGTFNRVNPDDVKNYLREAVRYGADVIDIVEIGNEWNLSAPWAWGGTPDPARAAAIVKAGAAGARQGKSSVKVVTPAVAPRPLEPFGDTRFLELMLQNLSSGDYDYVGMHPYIGSHAPESDPATCTPMCFRLVEEWYAAASRVHGSGTRAFITEMGTLEQSSADLGGYEWMELPADKRAEFLIRALQWGRSQYPWLVGAMVFNLDYASVNTQPMEQRAFSLLNADGSARLAWSAFRDAHRSGALAARPATAPAPVAPKPAPVAANYDSLIRDAFQVAFGVDPTADELKYYTSRLEATPSLRTITGLLGELEVRIKSNTFTRDDIFDRAWQDVYGYRLGGAPARWDQAMKDNGLWFATVLRALRVDRSYQDVFGRYPSQGELDYWMGIPANDSRVQSVQAMVDNHLQYLAGDSNARAGLIRDSYMAVFGRGPDGGELEFWLGQPAQTIHSLIETHRQFLAEQWPGIVNDSYWAVFGRLPNSGEAAYWQSQAPRPLAGMVQNHLQFLAGDRGAKSGQIRDSYLAVFGREPSSGELDFWLGEETQLIWGLIERHKQYLADAWPGIVDDSYAAVFGRQPSEDERAYWMSQTPRPLTGMVQNHLEYLAGDRGAREAVISDSYWAVFGRPATDGEFDFWLGQPVQPIHSLIAAHHEFLASSPADGSASSGSMFTGSGAPLALPSNPGLLTSMNGGSMVAAGAGNLIGMDGASMVAAGAGNLIGMDGGSMVAAGGLNLIGMDGGSMVAAGAGNLVGNNGNTMMSRP
jgi:hypothetical protein